MLSQQATEFLIKLCEAQPSDKYTVKEWAELYAINSQEDESISKDLWEEIKLNACVDIKYFDNEEVCFAITSKARLIVQDYNAIAEEVNEENAIVKTDSLGRSVVVLPKGKTFENAIKEHKTRLKSFLYGILGGLVGGMCGGGIVYAIIHFVVGA